jgi:hypothetical protein
MNVGDDTRNVGVDTRNAGDDTRNVGDDTRNLGDDTRNVAMKPGTFSTTLISCNERTLRKSYS